MGYNDADVYYQPEHFGLEIIFAAEKDLSWEFNMFIVWQDAEGQIYYASDAGCSCPSPFEDFTSLEDLTLAGTKASVVDALESWGGTQDDIARLYDKLYY